MPVAIQCRDLRKTYDGKVEAVRGLNLEIETGECFGLLGPNGAGKTTTIEILEGLLEPTSGKVTILGHDWQTNARELREWLGISLQETRLSEKLTVRETIELFSSFYREPRSSDDVLTDLQLNEKADAWVGKLSGGQRQRLAVATALVGNPKVLFLDEPTVGLDLEARHLLWQEIRNLLQRGKTVVLTTHYLEEADSLADRIVVINKGSLIAQGTPAEIKARTAGKRIRCSTQLSLKTISGIPGVSDVRVDRDAFVIHASQAEDVLRHLLHFIEHLACNGRRHGRAAIL